MPYEWFEFLKIFIEYFIERSFCFEPLCFKDMKWNRFVLKKKKKERICLAMDQRWNAFFRTKKFEVGRQSFPLVSDPLDRSAQSQQCPSKTEATSVLRSERNVRSNDQNVGKCFFNTKRPCYSLECTSIWWVLVWGELSGSPSRF